MDYHNFIDCFKLSKTIEQYKIDQPKNKCDFHICQIYNPYMPFDIMYDSLSYNIDLIFSSKQNINIYPFKRYDINLTENKIKHLKNKIDGVYENETIKGVNIICLFCKKELISNKQMITLKNVLKLSGLDGLIHLLTEFGLPPKINL